jgi:hypothetical protein
LQMHYKTALSAAYLQEEDARVHCAVLKIRTALGPATTSAVERPSPSRSPRAVHAQTGFLRTQQRAHLAAIAWQLVPCRPRRAPCEALPGGTYWPRPCAAAR